MKKRYSVAVIGPSRRFLSGISYFTIRLSNALFIHADVTAVLFRNMLPAPLFPGWKRIGTDISTQEFKEGIEVHEILDWYNPLSWVTGWRIAHRSDVIILEWWTSSVAHMYLIIELLLFKNKPVVIEFHEVVDTLEDSIWILRVYAKVAGRLVRSLASWYVVHSEADRALVISRYHVPPERTVIIPHGLYDQYPVIQRAVAKEKLGIREDYTILFFGLLRPYKGVKTLIEAFGLLPRGIVEQSRLLIVGEAWEDQESVLMSRESKYKDRITVIDRYVTDDEISIFFSAADVLVIPYTRASASGVAHIGMAFGLPIVASSVGGLLEGLGTYSGTTFVQPQKADDLAAALLYVADHRQYFAPPEELRWEAVGKKWKQLLDQIEGQNP
ncbi:MAG: glycosyltransferase [Methanoregulaceae archaeon]|nr:glycosyltransferase [Methanoregulaceae archaeon]